MAAAWTSRIVSLKTGQLDSTGLNDMEETRTRVGIALGEGGVINSNYKMVILEFVDCVIKSKS